MIRDFEYFAPKTLKEALTLLDKYRDDCKLIAGGQSLLILMRQGLVAPEYLIDIKGISELDYIKLDGKEGLRIGSLTTHRSIEQSPEIQNRFGVLAEMEQNLASVETRNWGTIGGNLCHADPAADPAPVLVALNGSLKLASLRGERTMSVEAFSQDYFEAALEYDEILTEILVPSPPPRTGTAYTKFSLLEGDFALVSAAVSVTLNLKDDTCSDVRIVLGAVAPVAMIAGKAGKALIGKEITGNLLEEAGQLASEEAKPISDIGASEEYRRELVKVLVKRVGKEALSRAKRA